MDTHKHTLPTDRELHLHLYGCLTAEHVWEMGRDCWQTQQERLIWYADEYQKAWQRKPDWSCYWQNDAGLDLLKEDFLCTHAMNFAQFQAKFNLLIALFPMTPSCAKVLHTVAHAHAQSGLKYCEYRTLLPLYFQKQELDQYLQLQHQTALDIAEHYEQNFLPRLVWTLPRDNELLPDAYNTLRQWLAAHPKLATATTGIDFCMSEEDDTPSSKQNFFAQVKEDNQSQHPLQILLHVGECFERTSLAGAARKVWQANEYGVDRLGHGVALGYNPQRLKGETVTESSTARIEHLQWLLDQTQWHQDLQLNSEELNREITSIQQSNNPTVELLYDAATVEKTALLQTLLMKDLSQKAHCIESCPTSNLRLSGMRELAHHPLPLFAKNGLNFIISSDDPGIFATDLQNEITLAQSLLADSPA